MANSISDQEWGLSDEELPEEIEMALATAEDEEIAAAIVAALATIYSLDICQSRLGSTLESGPGSWWLLGRIQQHSTRRLKISRTEKQS